VELRPQGNLIGVPYRRGVKKQGGMPADFQMQQHGLTQLQVAAHNGVVFASFDPAVPSFADYLSPEVLKYFERVFPDPASGREPVLLGYSRQRIPGNWKLMQENIKDPYHPGLLHVFFVTFGLWRPDQQSRLVTDPLHRHACMISQRNAAGAGEATQGVSTFRENLKLQDDRILDVVTEPWWDGPTVCMTTIFPTLVVQQQVNSLSTRHIIPRGRERSISCGRTFGYTDRHAEDAISAAAPAGEPVRPGRATCRRTTARRSSACSAAPRPPCIGGRPYNAMDGFGVGGAEHMVTESLIAGHVRILAQA
jgi:salicylate 5-hydroxylase large subunit